MSNYNSCIQIKEMCHVRPTKFILVTFIRRITNFLFGNQNRALGNLRLRLLVIIDKNIELNYTN